MWEQVRESDIMNVIDEMKIRHWIYSDFSPLRLEMEIAPCRSGSLECRIGLT